MRIVAKGKHRASVLGLVKFIAAVAIVYFHTLMGAPRHFSALYLLVELFFFITGYYTFKHFQDKVKDIRTNSVETKSLKALKYTGQKVLSLAPYILIAISLHYAILLIPEVNNGGHAIFDIVKGLPFDLLLLNTQAGVMNWPMWFVSAMIIVMPVFCLLCQSKDKHCLFIFSSLACLVYYFNYFRWPFGQGTFYVAPLIRAFMGMLMGVNIYVVAEWLGKAKITKGRMILLQICEVAALIFSFVMMYPRSDSPNSSIFRELTLLSFFIYLCIFMSGKTIASKISSVTMDFLERVSVIIFMIHIPILNLVYTLKIGSGVSRTIIIIVGSILGSALIFVAVNCVRRIYHNTTDKKSQI